MEYRKLDRKPICEMTREEKQALLAKKHQEIIDRCQREEAERPKAAPLSFEELLKQYEASQQTRFEAAYNADPQSMHSFPPGIACQCLLRMDLTGATPEQIDARYKEIIEKQHEFGNLIGRSGQVYNWEVIDWEDKWRGDAYFLAKYGKSRKSYYLDAEYEEHMRAFHAAEAAGPEAMRQFRAWVENDELKHGYGY